MKQTNESAVKNESAIKPAAKKDNRGQYVTRESVLMLLSDDETAAVATAETANRLPEGDEYLDMKQLGQGVQKAHNKRTPMAGCCRKSRSTQTRGRKFSSSYRCAQQRKPTSPDNDSARPGRKSG